LPGTNTLAYLASSSAMKEKSFITLTPGRTRNTSLKAGHGTTGNRTGRKEKKMDVKSYFMCSPLISEAGSLNKRSCLAAALGAIEFTTSITVILVPLCCAA
jgi:hypothetical protein